MRGLTMRLRILQQRAELIKSNVLEQKLDLLEKAFEAWSQRQQIKRIA